MQPSIKEGTLRGADVIVIGAGVLGAFHAYFAALKGKSVLLLERNALPNDASVRNFGMLPQTIVDPDGPWAQFAASSADIYRDVQQHHDISVSQRGSLYIASTELENRVLQEFAQRSAGRITCDYIDRPKLLRRFPFILASYARGGLLFPGDLGLDPRIMLHRLIPYLCSLGVEFVPHTAVAAMEPWAEGCTVRASDGKAYAGGEVFLCSGADATTLFPEVFARSGLQVCKLQMMRTAPVDGVRLPHSILSGLSIRRYPAFAACPSFPLLEAEPMEQKLRQYGIHLLVKSEADGSVTIGDSHQYAPIGDASAFRERTDTDINESILDYARSMITLPSWRVQQLWNGYYLTHEQDPIFTATVDAHVHIVTGIGGKGMSTGPGFARHSIDTILG